MTLALLVALPAELQAFFVYSFFSYILFYIYGFCRKCIRQHLIKCKNQNWYMITLAAFKVEVCEEATLS